MPAIVSEHQQRRILDQRPDDGGGADRPRFAADIEHFTPDEPGADRGNRARLNGEEIERRDRDGGDLHRADPIDVVAAADRHDDADREDRGPQNLTGDERTYIPLRLEQPFLLPGQDEHADRDEAR